MRDAAIRHLAACDESSLVAAALFESTVQIWNRDKAQQIGEFEMVLDFGGRRRALAAGGSICVTGSWTHGLAAYSVPDGGCLWQRPDLVQVQLLTLSASGQEVNCGFEKHQLAVIEVKTGTIVRTVKNASRMFCSRFGSCHLVQEGKRYRVVGEHAFEIPAMSFSLDDAALSPEAVCISPCSYGTNPIRAL